MTDLTTFTLKEMIAGQDETTGNYGFGLVFETKKEGLEEQKPIITLEFPPSATMHQVADRLVSAGKELRRSIRESEDKPKIVLLN